MAWVEQVEVLTRGWVPVGKSFESDHPCPSLRLGLDLLALYSSASLVLVLAFVVD